jgi:hypothetical protein
VGFVVVHVSLFVFAATKSVDKKPAAAKSVDKKPAAAKKASAPKKK